MPRKAKFRFFYRFLQRCLFVSAVLSVSIVSVAWGDCFVNVYHYCNSGLGISSLMNPVGHDFPDVIPSAQWPSLSDYTIGSGRDFCTTNGQLDIGFNGWYCRNRADGTTIRIYGTNNDDYAFDVDYAPACDTNIDCYAQWTVSGGAVVELVNPCATNYSSQFLYARPGSGSHAGVYRVYNPGESNPFNTKMSPLPNATNPVNVPNETCFVGYTSNKISNNYILNNCCFGTDYFLNPVINSYGELFSAGETTAIGYQNGSYNLWTAVYLNSAYTIKLDSTDADIGQHGQEFLYYTNRDGLRAYVMSGQSYQPDSSALVAGSMITIPTRTGFVFIGYYSAPSGGVQYVDADGRITSAAISALPNMTWPNNGGGNTCNVWYAHWEKYYDVEYNPGTCTNGVTGNSQVFSNDAIHGTPYTIRGLGTGSTQSGITINPGFHFNGWLGSSTDTNYTPVTYTETQTINPYNIDGDLTLTAQVAGNTTTINYSCGTGADISGNPPNSDTMTRACTQMTPNDGHLFWYPAQNNGQNPCTKTGHFFVGWDCPDITCQGSAGLCINGLSVLWSDYNFADGTVVTCTAFFAPEHYTVTYDYGAHANNGVTGTAYTHTNGATYGQNYIVPAAANNAITPATGYVFVGWNTSYGATTSNFPDAAASPWSRTSGLTVYAAYDCASGYHWKNGECVGYNLTYTPGDAWGQGNNYTEYVAGGTTHNLQNPADIGITPASNAYVFSEWQCTYYNPGVAFLTVNNNTVTMPTADVVCKAEWECAPGYVYDGVRKICRIPYTISFVRGHNENNSTMANQYPVFEGDSVILNQNEFTAPDNYYFHSWVCLSTGLIDVTVTVTQSGGNFIINPMPATNLVCTAQWQGNLYKVSYMPGAHGVGNGYAEYVTYNDSYTVLSYTHSDVDIEPESAEYVFAGWLGDYPHTVSGQSSYNYTPGESFLYNISGNLTLTAQWNCATGYHWNDDNTECVIDTFNVVYSCGAHGSGTPVDSNSPYVSGATVTVLGGNVCVADTGYQFKNWSCDNNIGDKNANTTFTMPSANVTCTAQWDSVIALTWDTNGGTPASVSSPASCVIGTSEGQTGAINNIAQPIKTGYRFLGWGIVWNFADININLSGANRYAKNQASMCWYNGDSDSCSNTAYSDLTARMWKIEMSSGTVYGTSQCQVRNCYCKATGFSPSGSNTIFRPSVEQEWEFVGELLYYGVNVCTNRCAMTCSNVTEQTFQSILGQN